VVESLSNLPIAVDTDGLDRAFYSVRTLARSSGLTSYDASYLELAMRLGLPLATLDKDLANASTSVGVQLIA
jgi:predicted nucleic acid-binding protein